MDNNISRGLELGIGFVIFVAGLGFFFSMGQSMEQYISEATRYENRSMTYTQSGDYVPQSEVGIDEIYFALMDESEVRIFVDGTELLRVSERVSRIDGMTTYEAAEGIRQEVAAIGSGDYDIRYVYDGDGTVTAIRYTQ